MNAISKWLMALALLTGPVVVDAQTYLVTELGSLGGTDGTQTTFNSVNDLGQVAGNSYIAGNVALHAFVTQNGVMQDLGTLGGSDSSAGAINDAGQVTGSAATATGATHAFVTQNGAMQDLGTLGGTTSAGSGINAAGQVTGYSYTITGATHAFVTQNGVMEDLGTLPGGNASGGTSINDSGQVTGFANVSTNGLPHAFVTENGVMQDLGTLGGSQSYGYAINNAGQVTGYVAAPNGIYAFITQNGVMSELPGLGGSSSRGYGINDAGQVVGDSLGGKGAGVGSGLSAVLWSGGNVTDLNTLIDPSSPLAMYITLQGATGISNTGFIAVVGIDSRTPGINQVFLLQMEAPETLACPAATAQMGASYSSALTAAGGVPPYTFSNTGNLPGGLTLNASTGAVTGTPTTAGVFSFTAKVVDSSGLAAGTVTASCTITVSPAPNFSISALPASVSIVQGSSGTSAISTKALYGFAGSINLQQSGAPTGTSVTFMPTSVSAGSTSTMQITVGSSTAVGTYPVTVTGTSGALSHTTNVSLTVTPTPLQLSVTPSSLEFGSVPRFSLRFKTVTLKNTGTGPVSISRVSVTPAAGTDRRDFTPISLCRRTLDAGQRCEIIVVLFANQLGSLSATLNIPNNAVTSPQSVALSATVTKDW